MIRGHKVMLDSDLAELYGVETKRLNEQVHRNLKRFPDDFMFQLTEEEAESLRSHFATLKSGRGRHRKYLPYAFTEQGVSMLSSVLNSDLAIEVNVQIIRTFVKLREMLELFNQFRERVLNLDSSVTEEILKLYIAYKSSTNFVDVVPQKSRLRLSINMRFSEMDDPKGLCKDVTNLGSWGNGDVEDGLSSAEQLDDVMYLVTQSFEKNLDNEGQ
ncbi:MAG: ORF6N domain-containing protein [Thermodesulfovibrionales bacterium]